MPVPPGLEALFVPEKAATGPAGRFSCVWGVRYGFLLCSAIQLLTRPQSGLDLWEHNRRDKAPVFEPTSARAGAPGCRLHRYRAASWPAVGSQSLLAPAASRRAFCCSDFSFPACQPRKSRQNRYSHQRSYRQHCGCFLKRRTVAFSAQHQRPAVRAGRLAT